METDEQIILVIGVVLLIAKIAEAVISDVNEMKPKFIEAITSQNAIIVYALLLFVVFVYFNYKLNYLFIKWKERRKSKKEQLKFDVEEAENLLDLETKFLDSESLRKHFNLILSSMEKLEDDKKSNELRENLKNKVFHIELDIPVLAKEERLDNLKRNESKLMEEIRHLEYEKNHKLIELREFEETSLRKLRADENPVFIESDLTEKEKTLLLKHDYQKAYEYCIDKQRFIHVLVKPTMKHSVAHTFLVWSAMKMLDKIKGITNICDWDTRKADITFRYNKEDFALEIETGTILPKRHQLRAKVDYLNKKYKNKWMIIVSKKKLVPKYSQFGKVSSRSDVHGKLRKLLKLAPSP